MFVTRYARQFAIISAIVIAVSAGIVLTFGLKLSIDFTGGSLTQVSYDTIPDKALVESQLNDLGITGYSLREAIDDSGRDGYILRSKELNEVDRVNVTDTLTSLGEGGTLNRFTAVGPVIGDELRRKAVWAIGAVALVIVLYVAFAFRGLKKPVSSWVYGGITILSLIHDVLVPTALMSLLGYIAGVEIDILFIMAILAVLGYSVNDTIVVFDRVRENLLENDAKHKGESFPDLVGRSVAQTFLRSFNTSFTTFIALLALYFLGGEVTRNFALVLMAGVVAGTYSSIFMGSPLLVLYASWQTKRKKGA